MELVDVFKEKWLEDLPSPDDEDNMELFHFERVGLFEAITAYMNQFFVMINGDAGGCV